ncbi:MAG TPA: TonB-dependent receptor plug domain-containing protein [Kofleriaceae bacterium]|nr:TonB-dependent receptor plug domain-containing protein [Kofleriaceae bacterium]
MSRPCNYLISVALAGTLWGRTALADEPSPPAAAAQAPAAPASAPASSGEPRSGEPAAEPARDPAPRPAPDPATAPGTPSPTAAVGPAETGVSDAALATEAGGEAIEIFDERPDKPFDRDTEVRLTGAELAARGAVDLATALALLPDVTVRAVGRGGFNVDIRGARKGAVSVLIDGVPVTDPYYGTFDVSTIPITDIVQIRVATTPQSPIDGPGGPGGVIEVHTRDAVGPQLVIGRLIADSAPSLGMTGTARFGLARNTALRLSASGLGGARDLELPGDAAIGEERHAVTGAGRLEYRDGARRVAIDGFLDDRHYVSPPSDTQRSTILLIDRETSARASIKGDDKLGPVQLQAEAWSHYLSRHSRFFADPALTSEQQLEYLRALRSGAMALATMPFWKQFRWAASTTIDYEKAAVSNIDNAVVRGEHMVVELAGDLQYEHGQLRADLATGVAVPFGVGARPWPEAKGAVKYRLLPELELTATGAYKGRLASLRERFDPEIGNRSLGPERIAHAELRAALHMTDRVHVELAPYYKRSMGTIRVSDDPENMGHLINLGTIGFWGVDTMVRVTPHPMFELGGGYGYIKAHATATTAADGMTVDLDDPLDRLPRHRWDAWISGRPHARISGLARVKYFGSSIDRTQHVDGYALVEASLTGQITPRYLGVLRIDDLLDERPETRAGYHAAGRVVSLVVQGTWE